MFTWIHGAQDGAVYDVDFDDGDVEKSVKRQNIRSEADVERLRDRVLGDGLETCADRAHLMSRDKDITSVLAHGLAEGSPCATQGSRGKNLRHQPGMALGEDTHLSSGLPRGGCTPMASAAALAVLSGAKTASKLDRDRALALDLVRDEEAWTGSGGGSWVVDFENSASELWLGAGGSETQNEERALSKLMSLEEVLAPRMCA